MLSDDKLHVLQSYLNALPPDIVTRLALMVERDALAGGKLPHAELLRLLRPQLRNSRLPRLMGPQRAFCMPFEDLLCDGPRDEKRKGCIARSSIRPVWRWLETDLIPDMVRDYIGDIKSFLLAGETENAEQCARGFRRSAGEAMLEALTVDGRETRKKLGGSEIAGDAEDMALLALGESFITELKAMLPKPVSHLTDADLTAFRGLHKRALNEMPDLVPYLPVVAMARLEKPWQAIRLALIALGKRSETVLESTDMGLVGDILFAELDDARADLQEMRGHDFNVEILLDRLTDFALLASGISGEVELLRHSRWGKRLVACRALVSAIMENHLIRTPKIISTALPLKLVSRTRREKVADIDRVVSEQDIADAIRYARLFAGCRYLAASSSFQSVHEKIGDELTKMLDFYNNAILEERSTQSPLMQTLVDERVELAHKLTGIVLGADEADRFARRDRMAAVA